MDHEVWIVFPEAARERTARVRRRVRQECHSRAWRLQERPSRERRLHGRPVQVLEGTDAANMYRRLHRVRVCVLFAGKPVIPMRVGAPVSGAGGTIALATFVRYKSHAARLPQDPAEIPHRFEDYEAWCQRVECEGGRDPRCLPLHVFKSGKTDLDTLERRRYFDDTHGTGARRQDDNHLTWRLEPASFHGRELLHVAGRELPRGFHWDVSVGRTRTITTALLNQVWVRGESDRRVQRAVG